jgi:hypothetical protein
LFNQRIQTNNHQDLPIFIQWMAFLKWFFLATEKFPKKVRINSLALNVIEDLIEARYVSNKRQILKKINITLEKIRVLLRICFESQVLPQKAYEHSAFSLNEIGRMLGGWMKQQDGSKSNAKTEGTV